MISKSILLVADDPPDEMLALRVLRKINLINEGGMVRDGQQAVDYLFRQGEFAKRAELPERRQPFCAQSPGLRRSGGDSGRLPAGAERTAAVLRPERGTACRPR